MGFFSGIANIGSKILGGIKHAAQWVAPTLHKVLSTISGPVGMIHPGIGGALGAGPNLEGDVDRFVNKLLKRGSSGGGMMQNDKYQLFIDNDNALVQAANNQIIDGYAADYELKTYPTPTHAQVTPQMHYLCDAIICFTFDDAPDPQVQNFEIIGEIGGTMVRSG
ncbi:MAG: hypothetical protein EZS28_019946 [Streblomastix strix]|uniref:Uncharacterized protein n=1 Tax=Streblomastix strix TaxID=222440 RepID=A0A5J4VQA0_9EUKA|nr:MAG: hypothetical protein EZS28_019946 [Streblomastix strix]